ncbi:translation initiation factor IF-3 [Candidatus Gracilibacteria bacterium]|nr:translation initiation factor IF-3 [Candidatus Gracilibacteria bacterium]
MKEKKRILNDHIRADKVQLITDEGENLGDMSLSEAKQKASDLELDLMEMGKKGDITIIKMLDYGKFLYRQKKQDQKNKQKGKAPELKTIRITFKIGDHDLEIRKKQAEKFAASHHPLKISLMLRGRENQYGDIAREKITSFVASLEELYKLESPIKQSGNTFSAMLKPIK